jgi:hypothetical protein
MYDMLGWDSFVAFECVDVLLEKVRPDLFALAGSQEMDAVGYYILPFSVHLEHPLDLIWLTGHCQRQHQ